MRQSWIVWDGLELFGAVCDSLGGFGRFGTVCDSFGQFETFWNGLGPYGKVLASVGQFMTAFKPPCDLSKVMQESKLNG